MVINEIREKIVDTLYSKKRPAFKKSQLFFMLKIDNKDSNKFDIALKNLIKEKLVLSNNKISAVPNYFIGYMQCFNKDEHYIYIGQNKYKIENSEIKNSIHGDKVIFEIVDEFMLVAKVINVIKRKPASLSGTYVEYNGIGFLIPDSPKFTSDIYIQKGSVSAEPYEKILIKIDEYKVFGKPEGSINRKITNGSIKDLKPFEYIIDKYEIKTEFSSDSIKKAMLSNVPLKQNIFNDNRVDLRAEKIFTIDGEHAKDFDDAISVRKINDKYELGVYIADVTYYVPEGSALDRDAFDRGTSYYLDNVCIPMLPQALSNGACSLSEGTDKLAIGIKVIMDSNGELLSRDLFECVINSKKRFTYEEINDYLSGTNPNLKNNSNGVFDDLMLAIEAANILRNKRQERGCIDFDFSETEFYRDEDQILGFGASVRGLANKTIEEFMIMANESVAKAISDINHPFIYRTHGAPFSEKLEVFCQVCKNYGIDCSSIDIENPTSKQFKNILDGIEDSDLRKCINMNLITTMKQARYTPENIGHFGLASTYYCHFTSPIRRYPDLFNHRIVKKYIRKTINNDITRMLFEKGAEKISKHCCYTERNSSHAEEELEQLQIMEFMTSNPEENYEAIVYSINKNGFYVLIKDVITGFIRMPNAEVNETMSKIYNCNEEYNIGDRITINFKEYDIKNGKLVFLVNKEV